MVTDVYNTGKGYAFVTFDREEDSKMAIQVNSSQISKFLGSYCTTIIIPRNSWLCKSEMAIPMKHLFLFWLFHGKIGSANPTNWRMWY